MPVCAVFGCNNNRNTKQDLNSKNRLRFFRFPTKNASICKQWVWACKRKDPFSLKHAVICSAHFEKSKYTDSCLLKQRLMNYYPKRLILRPDAVPTLHLWCQQKHLHSQAAARTTSNSPGSSGKLLGISYTYTWVNFFTQCPIFKK